MNDRWTDEQWDAIVDLLTYIAAADRRTVGKTDVRVWLDAANDGEWPSIDFAYRAVIRHRNENPGKWLEPGHITQALRRVHEAATKSFELPEIPREVEDDVREYQRWVAAQVKAHHDHAIETFASGATPPPPKAIEA